MPKYYSLEESGEEADLYIFGDITTLPFDEKDRDAYGIVKELQALEADKVNVHINSYGGDVSEGLAIYNVLKNSRAKVTTYCDGFACSAASVIFMAGEERIMNSASLLLIHNAWSWASGNANDFRKQAEDLDKITQASINAYMSRIWITEEELKEKMDAETWLTAEEALADGFATKILEEEETRVNQSAFRLIRDRMLEPKTATPQEGILEVEIPLDVEKVAEKVAEKIKGLIVRNDAKDGQQAGNLEDSTGWGAFFNGKGDKK